MALSDDLNRLRDHALIDLTSAHDYFSETQEAWQIVRNVVARGATFSVRNRATGTTTAATELVARSRGYVTTQLTEATFQLFLSIFENFFFDLLRLWLTEYPRSLGKRSVDFKTILDLPDKAAITQLVVKKELDEVLYNRPSEWFAYLEEKVNLGCPSADEIEQLAEAKASRDVLVHNRGVATKIYESKAGRSARFRDGERIEIPDDYHRATWELVRKLVADIANAAIAKAP